jgi:hypothetical protein
MASAGEHYENHLADYDAWIFGGVDLKIGPFLLIFITQSYRQVVNQAVGIQPDF